MNHAVTSPSRCHTSSENKPQWRIRNRAIFYWVSEVIRNCINFALPHSVIGPEILSHPLNQSYSKPKPVRLVHTRFSAPCSDYSISIDVLIGPLYYLAFWLAEMIGLSTCIGLTLLKIQPIKCQMRFPAFHGGCIFLMWALIGSFRDFLCSEIDRLDCFCFALLPPHRKAIYLIKIIGTTVFCHETISITLVWDFRHLFEKFTNKL